jgi:hypothetical protein
MDAWTTLELLIGRRCVARGIWLQRGQNHRNNPGGGQAKMTGVTLQKE